MLKIGPVNWAHPFWYANWYITEYYLQYLGFNLIPVDAGTLLSLNYLVISLALNLGNFIKW